MSGRRSIFITGAAAGIGRATARRFAAADWFVGLYDVNEAGVRALQQELGADRACAGSLDVTDGAAVARALGEFFAAAGQRLDVMFNNAGIGQTGDFQTLSLEQHRRIVDVNFNGVINGSHAAFPYLKQTPGACLVSMSSASAIYGAPGLASYAATKFGVKGLSEALSIEWQQHDIAVMDLLPLFVDTDMVRKFEKELKAKDALGMHLTADDIAATVWRAVHWPRWWRRVHWYVGFQGWFLALAQKLSPAWVNRFTTKLISGY
jgi:NAD(P)-dependent dehydrogenase (short-subunit alcohol dehydrogenase family)